MPAKRFQFSLRTFFAACAAAALAISVVVWRYQAYERFQRTICRVSEASGFDGFNAVFDKYDLTYYKDRRNRPVAYLLLNYDSYSPNLPAMARHYRHSSSRGGQLTVDGVPVVPEDRPTLFVNGPYGYTVPLTLSDRDVAALESAKHPQIVAFWRDRVEPRIYRLKGTVVSGQRDGAWEFRLADDSLYLEANYKLGKRHGDWTTYFPNGEVQHRAHFDDGKPSGQWDYFDEAGALIGTLDWKDGFLRNEGNQRGGGAPGGSYHFHGNRGNETGYRLSEVDGGTFLLHGRQLIRPKLDSARLLRKPE